MSNFLAVATVTEALRQFIARSLVPDITFAVEVLTQKPPAEPPPNPTITVFMYQVTPNAALRNQDAPTRGPDGTVLTKPQAAIDLHYLVSFYGNEAELEPQRLLGCVVRSMYEGPVLSRVDIDAAAQVPHLAGTDLAASRQRVRFTPTHLDLDDLSRLWSMLFQTPYVLSVPYLASLVLLDGRATSSAGKPVLRRVVRAVPSDRPVIDRVLSREPGAGPEVPPDDGPVTAGRQLVLTGVNLGRPGLTALVGGQEVPMVSARDDQAVLDQPADLPPGVHTVLVRYGVPLGDPPQDRPLLESNAMPYIRRARVESATQIGTQIAVQLDIAARPGQRASLLLDEKDPVGVAHSYQFPAPFPLAPGADPVSELTVPIHGVAPATYLVQVQIDGAQSPLDMTGGVFSGPTVQVTG
jgi:Pvc16 N-terminal domain